jgi:hypothetical protein
MIDEWLSASQYEWLILELLEREMVLDCGLLLGVLASLELN